MGTIEVRSVTKRFPGTVAVDDLSVVFGENKICGLFGRNGAGKTTLLNLITGKLFPTGGEILLDGAPVLENDEALSHIYCMTEKNLYPENMKVGEAFTWSRYFYPGFDRGYAEGLCEKFGLNTGKKIRTLSTGYASIFKLIVALSCNAPVLLLDEPVLGLDAVHRDLFYRELVRSYGQNPRTVVISTHLIEEAAGVVEDVAIIKDGRMILKDSSEAIIRKGCALTGKASDVERFTEGLHVLGRDVVGGLETAYVYGEFDLSAAPPEIEVSRPGLQKLFVELTNFSGGVLQ